MLFSPVVKSFNMFDETKKPKQGEIQMLEEFKAFMKSKSEYIQDFYNEYFKEQQNTKKETSDQNQPQKNNNYRESNSKSQDEEQKINSQLHSNIKPQMNSSVIYSQTQTQSNQKSPSMQSINNLIFAIQGNEEDERKIEDILENQDHLNIIQISHFMNINTFHNYKSFNEFFQQQVKEILNYEQNVKIQDTISSIETVLKKTKKILLFDSYYFSTFTHNKSNCKVNQKKKNYNHTYYILAAEDLPSFNIIASTIHYYHKCSPYAIFSHIQERLKRIVFNTTKNIIQLTLHNQIKESDDKDLYEAIRIYFEKKTKQKTEQITELKTEIEEKIEENIKEKMQKMWTINECESIVYKNLCSHGLLPINVFLQSTGENQIIQKYVRKLFGLKIPFPEQFHMNVQVMNNFYSYTNSSIFHSKDLQYKEDRLKKGSFYSKVRVLDFFPLDNWIKQLGKIFKDQIINRIANHLDDNNFLEEIKNVCLNQNQIEQQSFLHMRFENIQNDDDNNMQQDIKDISYQFIKEYFFELRIFKEWAYILSKTEQQYDLIDNNCQTAVSMMIDHLTSTLGNFYESGENSVNYESFQEYKQKKFEQKPEHQDFFNQMEQCFTFGNTKTLPKTEQQNFERQEIILEYQNKRLLNQFQKFSSKKNYELLDKYIQPLKLYYSIPKYLYFCEQSEKNYMDQLKDGVHEIEKIFLISEKHCSNDFLKQIKKKIEKMKDFDKMHNLLRILMEEAQKQIYEAEPVYNSNIALSKKYDDFNGLISVLMNAYDSWYFQRRLKVDWVNITYKDSYEIKDILNELCYYYYNSVRFSSDLLFRNDNNFSIVGHLLIKNPEKNRKSFFQEYPQQ